MRNPTLAIVALCLLIGGGDASAQNRKCLHDADETSQERTRREKAVELAHDINAAEGMARRFGPRTDTGRYVPLDQLFNVPQPPDGFRVQLLTDGTTYSFSIKDTTDPCLYAVFSDQSGDVYEATPSQQKGRMRLLSEK